MGKTAIVTGCLGAIGAATSKALTRQGYRVVGIDLTTTGSHEGPYFQLDLADADAVQARMPALRELAGDGDVLVNNAGLYDPKAFFDLTLDDFDRVMTVNVRSMFLLSQAVARWMAEAGRPGSIIQIASTAGKLGSPIIPYGTSKAAVIGLTKSMARVLARHSIRVNAVAPGVVESAISKAVDPEQMKAQLMVVPMARVAEPEEIAGVVAFLASDAASYMTGSIVDVNGGWPL